MSRCDCPINVCMHARACTAIISSTWLLLFNTLLQFLSHRAVNSDTILLTSRQFSLDWMLIKMLYAKMAHQSIDSVTGVAPSLSQPLHRASHLFIIDDFTSLFLICSLSSMFCFGPSTDQVDQFSTTENINK